MVRKKNSKDLFEVLSQGRGTVGVPDWMRKKTEDQAENPPDKELPGDDLPLPASEKTEKTEKTEVEPVEAEEPATDDVEIIEPEAEPDERVVEKSEDQSVAETTEAELFTTEEDATGDAAETYTEITEIDDSETAEIVEDIEEPQTPPSEEPDEESVEEARGSDRTVAVIPRVKRRPPYEVPRDEPDLPTQQPEPLVQVHEGRIRISMTRVGAMVTLGAVLVLLVAAFAFGLGVGKSRSPEEQNQKLPPKAKGLHITGTRVSDPANDNGRGVLAGKGSRTVGRYYLVFEKLDGTGDVDRVDAANIMTLFRKRGFPSQLMNLAKRGEKPRWAIWGLHGFENPTGRAGRKYVDDVKRVGEEYFRKYGKYEFKNPYFLKKIRKPKPGNQKSEIRNQISERSKRRFDHEVFLLRSLRSLAVNSFFLTEN